MRYAGEIGVLAHDVPSWQLFLAFAAISVTGWGGGTGTIYTMRHELVRRGWITSAQFGLDFGLSRIVPGINLIALAVIVGYRLKGAGAPSWRAFAFVLPFSLITLMLTIGFVALPPIRSVTRRSRALSRSRRASPSRSPSRPRKAGALGGTAGRSCSWAATSF